MILATITLRAPLSAPSSKEGRMSKTSAWTEYGRLFALGHVDLRPHTKVHMDLYLHILYNTGPWKIVRDKVTRQCPKTITFLKRKERRAESSRGQTGSHLREACCRVAAACLHSVTRHPRHCSVHVMYVNVDSVSTSRWSVVLGLAPL